MYQKQNIVGTSLKEKEICLTFDDGPGKDTLEIAKFLHQQGVKAAFFVVGKFAVDKQDVLAEMQKLGHLICNHTYEHPDLPYYCSIDGDIHDQILRTDVCIQSFINGDTVYFRAPYGKWSPEVAIDLNANLLASYKHVGPIHWEIPGIDCYYWKLGKSVDEAVEEYIKNIDAEKRGIIVMHDEIADMDVVQEKNQTLQLVQKLIPELLKKGYVFKALDEIEDVIKEKSYANKIYLRNNAGLAFSADKHTIVCKNNSSSTSLQFELDFKEKGKVVFKTADKYIALDHDKLEDVLLSKIQDKCTEFDYIQVRNDGFMLRSYTGNYLAVNKEGKLHAEAQFMRQAEVFKFSFTDTYTKVPVSILKRLQILKKGFLFVKSKILSK